MIESKEGREIEFRIEVNCRFLLNDRADVPIKETLSLSLLLLLCVRIIVIKRSLQEHRISPTRVSISRFTRPTKMHTSIVVILYSSKLWTIQIDLIGWWINSVTNLPLLLWIEFYLIDELIQWPTYHFSFWLEFYSTDELSQWPTYHFSFWLDWRINSVTNLPLLLLASLIHELIQRQTWLTNEFSDRLTTSPSSLIDWWNNSPFDVEPHASAVSLLESGRIALYETINKQTTYHFSFWLHFVARQDAELSIFGVELHQWNLQEQRSQWTGVSELAERTPSWPQGGQLMDICI